ncbi:MAG: hypothetical protein A2Y23_07705 [Clostridiales bacterium GWB2_37_7]|nr:MAG: hypothetical protein A2Y23_07705 [Clostridiales bacterium GWB2_37_7]
MTVQIAIVLLLNFVITLIGTLAYAVRLVGVKTGRVAVSFALFNILALISRTANTFQVPLLTKYVEKNPYSETLIGLFNLVILTAVIASAIGAFMIPFFQRIFYKAVEAFSVNRSVYKLVLHSFSKSGVKYIKENIRIPSKINFGILNLRKLPFKLMLLNTISVTLLTVGALAPIYAGSLAPEVRATSITLSAILNGFAIIVMAVFIDPYLSIMTDDVIDGKCSMAEFNNCVSGMVITKIIGTALSFVVLVPSAYLIVWVARFI